MCITCRLSAGYQTVAVNMQHLYVTCSLSEWSGKCAESVCYVQDIRL